MKTDHLYIEDSSYYPSGDLVDILDFDKANLKLDKKLERSYCLLH